MGHRFFLTVSHTDTTASHNLSLFLYQHAQRSEKLTSSSFLTHANIPQNDFGTDYNFSRQDVSINRLIN